MVVLTLLLFLEVFYQELVETVPGSQQRRNKMEVIRQERGWAGHFICADRCLFRRNTLLTCGNIQIVISTVGLMENPPELVKERPDLFQRFSTIGYNRYYETMAFHADPNDTRYHDIDVTRQVSFDSPWAISELDADDKANEMHEQVVKEITEGLQRGKTYED